MGGASRIEPYDRGKAITDNRQSVLSDDELSETSSEHALICARKLGPVPNDGEALLSVPRDGVYEG